MKVSVIVTAYNYGLFLERCLRSLLEQSLPTTAYEIIVVDDASEDNTEDIMERYVEKYSNIRYIRNTKNVGVAESSNVAIREAFGQFIVRVDADDYVNKNFLLFLSAYLEANNGLLGVACDYVKVMMQMKRTSPVALCTEKIFLLKLACTTVILDIVKKKSFVHA